jgi:carboxyl-terminal processing protease
MPRFRTAAVATLLFVPLVAGGFYLERAPERANALLLQQVMQLVTTAYVDTLPASATYAKAATGLVRELNDPYSELLPPKESEDFERQTGGRYGGTGMLLGEPQPGVIIVDRVFPNTPAEEGGVREGDRVVGVDTAQAAELTLDKVSNLLRGDPGSKVSVIYARPGVAGPIKLQFTRRVIHVPAVDYTAMLGDHIGYIPLQTFNENAADEVAAAIDTLVGQGAKGLVLDMRDNGGGIVEQSLETASLFLRNGQAIASVRSRAEPEETLRSTGRHLALTIPLVVLLDGGSASATEIVAGALQDHDRALVVGTTSFGKGLVQSVYELDGGYHLKMTTGKWFTPSGRSIHRERKLLPNGAFVEVHPDSLAKENMVRPTFRSDAGRVVYGGGGIRPDVLVPDDTLSKAERDFLRAAATHGQEINTVLQDYARELKGTVSRDFTPSAAWDAELMRRIAAAGVTIDPRFQAGARSYLMRDLSQRVARLAFGDAVARERSVADDHQLTKAIELLQRSSTERDLLALASAAAPARDTIRQ